MTRDIFAVNIVRKKVGSQNLAKAEWNQTAYFHLNTLIKIATKALNDSDYEKFDETIIEIGEIIDESYKVDKLDHQESYEEHKLEKPGIGKYHKILKLSVVGKAIEDSVELDQASDKHFKPTKLNNLLALRLLINGFNDGKFSSKLRAARKRQIEEQGKKSKNETESDDTVPLLPNNEFDELMALSTDNNPEAIKELLSITDKNDIRLREKYKKKWNISTRHHYRYGMQLFTSCVNLELEEYAKKHGEQNLKQKLLEESYFHESDTEKALELDQAIFNNRFNYLTTRQRKLRKTGLFFGYINAIGCGISIAAECLALISLPYVGVVMLPVVLLVALGAIPFVAYANKDLAEALLPKILIGIFGRDKFLENMRDRPKTALAISLLSLFVALPMAALTYMTIAADISGGLAVAFPALFASGSTALAATSIICSAILGPIIAFGSFFVMASIVFYGWENFSQNPFSRIKKFMSDKSLGRQMALIAAGIVVLTGLCALFYVAGTFGLVPLIAGIFGVSQTALGAQIVGAVISFIAAVGMGAFYMNGTFNAVNNFLDKLSVKWKLFRAKSTKEQMTICLKFFGKVVFLAAVVYLTGTFALIPLFATALGVPVTSIIVNVLAYSVSYFAGKALFKGLISAKNRFNNAYESIKAAQEKELQGKMDVSVERGKDEPSQKTIDKTPIYVINAVYNGLLLLKTLAKSLTAALGPTTGGFLAVAGFSTATLMSYFAVSDSAQSEQKERELKEKGSQERIKSVIIPNDIPDTQEANSDLKVLTEVDELLSSVAGKPAKQSEFSYKNPRAGLLFSPSKPHKNKETETKKPSIKSGK